jgi:hypothetical protein
VAVSPDSASESAIRSPYRPDAPVDAPVIRARRMEHHAAKRDYLTLLGEGSVIRDTDDTDGWRKAIRGRARADRLRVRTGVARQMPSRAYAVLIDSPPPTDEEMREAAEKLDAYLDSLTER